MAYKNNLGDLKKNVSSIPSDNIINYNNKENFNKYLNEISKLRPLSREEETAIFIEIEKTGSKQAIDKICKHNMLFVIAVARKYFKILPPNTSLTFEDLVSEGNMGLCIAAQRFDYKTGNKFISYAVWWIKQQMTSCIQTCVKTIRIPSSARNIVTAYNKRESDLEQKLGRTPTTLEVFEKMLEEDEVTESYDLSKLTELLKMCVFETSLNKIISDGSISYEKRELIDMIKSDDEAPDDECIRKERNELLYEMLNTLPKKIKDYINDYFGLDGGAPLTLVEMSHKYDEEPATIKHRIDKYLLNIKFKNKDKKEFFFPTPDYEQLRLEKGRDKDARYLI